MSNELVDRLSRFEDNFTERKPDGTPPREIRATIVAFANCLPEGRSGVLFIGVKDNGKIQGVANPDSLQKTIRDICENNCYPPIKYRCEVLPKDGKQVLAIEVLYSDNKPHFSGPAFVRRGSENVNASEEQFQELVLTRLSKTRELLKWKDRLVSVETRGRSPYTFAWDYKIEEVTAHWVKIFEIPTGRHSSEELEKVSLATDEGRRRLKLIIA